MSEAVVAFQKVVADMAPFVAAISTAARHYSQETLVALRVFLATVATLARQYEDFFNFQALTEDKYGSAAATEGTFGAAAQPEALAAMQASTAAVVSASGKLLDHLRAASALGVPCCAPVPEQGKPASPDTDPMVPPQR